VEQRWQAKVNELEAQLQQKEDELSQARAHNSSAKVNELEIQLQQKEDELSQARAHKSSASSDAMTWNRIEGMVDENTKYRVRVARQMQQLRSEKEILQRELNQKEDENAELEARVEKLQRFSNAGLLQRILS
jgi:chromosome segregation ATPase